MEFKVKFFNEIYDDMAAWFFGRNDDVTSGHDGSVLMTIFEVIAQELERLYIDADIGMKHKIKEFLYSWFKHTRKSAQYAVGKVVFSCVKPAAQTIEIPAGTVVSTAQGVQFKTITQGLILQGETDSAEVAVEAQESGTGANVKSDSVTIINTYIPGVDSVTNPAIMSGGEDEEGDYEYEQRFINKIRGLGGSEQDGILYEIGQISGIYSVKIIEHFPPKSGINFTVLACESGGFLTEGKRVLVSDAVKRNKACGVNYTVRSPEKLPVNNLSITVMKKGVVENSVLIEEVDEYTQTFFSQMKIGESMNLSVLVYNLLGLDNVDNVVVTCEQAKDNLISCPAEQIIVLGSDFSVSVDGE